MFNFKKNEQTPSQEGADHNIILYLKIAFSGYTVIPKSQLDCLDVSITATGGPYSDLGLPTTKLEIRPCFAEYFI